MVGATQDPRGGRLAEAAFHAEAEGLRELESVESLRAHAARLRELERACHARYRGRSKG